MLWDAVEKRHADEVRVSLTNAAQSCNNTRTITRSKKPLKRRFRNTSENILTSKRKISRSTYLSPLLLPLPLLLLRVHSKSLSLEQ